MLGICTSDSQVVDYGLRKMLLVCVPHFTCFAQFPTWEVLFLSYPVTWVVTALIEMVCYAFVKRRAIAARGEMQAS